jgi:hypothetical protein
MSDEYILITYFEFNFFFKILVTMPSDTGKETNHILRVETVLLLVNYVSDSATK